MERASGRPSELTRKIKGTEKERERERERARETERQRGRDRYRDQQTKAARKTDTHRQFCRVLWVLLLGLKIDSKAPSSAFACACAHEPTCFHMHLSTSLSQPETMDIGYKV